MIKQYPKDSNEQLTEHFNVSEFKCHCNEPSCVVTYLSTELVEALQALRYRVGSLKVLSGYRCPLHNHDIGGEEHSFHKLGLAADVAHKKLTRYELRDEAKRIAQLANGGIGCYKWGCHFDVRGFAARWDG